MNEDRINQLSDKYGEDIAQVVSDVLDEDAKKEGNVAWRGVFEEVSARVGKKFPELNEVLMKRPLDPIRHGIEAIITDAVKEGQNSRRMDEIRKDVKE